MNEFEKKKKRQQKGYRLYNNEKYYCKLCNKDSDSTVFVIGWGNVLRCYHCLFKVGSRKNLLKKGTPFQYLRGSRLVKVGVE